MEEQAGRSVAGADEQSPPRPSGPALPLRNPALAAARDYDLIIIGGGVYGVMLSYEASRRGLRSILVERDDFGGATTFNSLRIIHGGFRYLQSLDLRRFRESVQERRWFLRVFPGLVKPLGCLMPLNGRGLYRPSVFRAGLLVNDLLSCRRNRGVDPERRLPQGRLIGPEPTIRLLPSMAGSGLKGGAVWYDAMMSGSQRVLLETLRWSGHRGAAALNYLEASRLLTSAKAVAGLEARDRETGQSHELRAPVVVNAGGPWSRSLAAAFDRDEEALFRSSLAWNVLLDRPPLSDHALGLSPPGPGRRIYFLVPWKGRLMAGTVHAPWPGGLERPQPSADQVEAFLHELNQALPALELDRSQVIRVLAGLMPVTRPGSVALSRRPVVVDHGRRGGPPGLYSVSGVKFTTARLVAERTLDRIFPGRRAEPAGPEPVLAPDEVAGRGEFAFDWRPEPRDTGWQARLRALIAEESVCHLDDLVVRRTTLWENPARSREIAPALADLFDWDQARRREEFDRLKLNG